MLQNAYFHAKIGADTAENEQHFAENLPKICNYPTGVVAVNRVTALPRRPPTRPEGGPIPKPRAGDPRGWRIAGGGDLGCVFESLRLEGDGGPFFRLPTSLPVEYQFLQNIVCSDRLPIVCTYTHKAIISGNYPVFPATVAKSR